MTLKTEENGF